MDDSYQVTDPTDWLQTRMPQLVQVEAALRCQVCKDFYGTPMITSCSHTFCSLCIRRCLTSDGMCPVCRAPDQELRLRRNWVVQELVDVFQAARPVLIKLGEYPKSSNLELQEMNGKRKLEASNPDQLGELDGHQEQRRKTWVQNKGATSAHLYDSDNVLGDQEGSDYGPNDGLAACPICNQRMREEEVFPHLDDHSNAYDSPSIKPSGSRLMKSLNGVSKFQPSSNPPERLPQLSYSILKDNALRKKLTELGIPTGGSRALLIRRHMEWVNLVNANSDSSRPRTKRELLHELDIWDRSQGRHISNFSGDLMGGGSVMRKDFDGEAWAISHGDEFRTLIGKARQKAGYKRVESNSNDTSGVPEQNQDTYNLETISNPAAQCDLLPTSHHILLQPDSPLRLNPSDQILDQIDTALPLNNPRHKVIDQGSEN